MNIVKSLNISKSEVVEKALIIGLVRVESYFKEIDKIDECYLGEREEIMISNVEVKKK
jgi:hypothetical protein